MIQRSPIPPSKSKLAHMVSRSEGRVAEPNTLQEKKPAVESIVGRCGERTSLRACQR